MIILDFVHHHEILLALIPFSEFIIGLILVWHMAENKECLTCPSWASCRDYDTGEEQGVMKCPNLVREK
jgi:hypothetical protein